MSATVVALPGAGADVLEPDWAAVMDDPLDLARAHEAWAATVAEMRAAGTLSPANGEQIRRYVVACVLFGKAEAQVFAEGPVIPRKKGQLPAWNLWFSVLKDADSLASGHEDKLGISPRRRAQVAPARKRAAKVVGADRFLGSRS